MAVNVIVQARMGSKRFPGKVMADLHGTPMIGHLIDYLRQVKTAGHIIYAIPEADMDGPLGKYLEERNVDIVTGPEEDVAERFRLALEQFPCEAFIRICADTPMAVPEFIEGLIVATNDGEVQGFAQHALVEGATMQYCHTKAFLYRLPEMTPEEREHVLVCFVRETSMLVDYPEDLERIRNLTVPITVLDRRDKMFDA